MFSLLASAADRAAWKTNMEWHDATFIHPLALLIFFCLGVWFLLARRGVAILPLILLICCVPSAQRVVIGGADFSLLRLMVCVGCVRLLMKGELKNLRLNRVDTVFFFWLTVAGLVYIVQRGDFSSVVYVCGQSLDAFGGYIVIRGLIRNADELKSMTRNLAVVAIPICMAFMFEMATGKNLFALFGGVPAETLVRDGRLRCQGAFSHPILAGVFWASLAPVFMAGVLDMKSSLLQRSLFGAAFVSASMIVVASSSSTPLLGSLAGLFFWACWPLRKQVRYAFMLSPFVLIALHLTMEAPVWHLISRVSAVGGSTVYHRFVLIDEAINHFNEWWLVGTTWTGHWSEHYQTWDITNQYILEGVRGGVWRLLLFCLLLFVVARSFGRAQSSATLSSDELLLWGWGSSVFVHAVCFIGVSYFGQIEYLWYMTLSLAACVIDPGFLNDEWMEEAAIQYSDDGRAKWDSVVL